MAIYEIDGRTFEVPDDLSGDALMQTLDSLAQNTAKASEDNLKKFLGLIGKAEGADYDTLVGGSKFTDYSKHPNTVGLTTKDGASKAAGRYQITKTTYDDIAPALGITDFSPESQDKIAIEIIKRGGVLEAVKQGRFEEAVNKLGGRWASFPSSPWKQNKRSTDWFNKELAALRSGEAPQEAAPTTQQAAPVVQAQQPNTEGYIPFAPIRKDIDPDTLNQDKDFLRASKVLYENENKKPWDGSDDDLADWGKNYYAQYYWNMALQAKETYDIMNSPEEAKKAMVYMLDTFPNIDASWGGVGRAIKWGWWDPSNLASVGSLGLGFLAKKGAQKAAVEGVKMTLKESLKNDFKKGLGRTGVVAGIDSALMGAASDAMEQNVRIDAGAQKEFSYEKLAESAAISGVAGTALGTTADVALSNILKGVRKVLPKKEAEVPATPKAELKVGDEATDAADEAVAAQKQAEFDAQQATTPTNAPEPTISGEPRVTPGETPNVAPKASEGVPDPNLRAADGSGVPTSLTPEEIVKALKEQQGGRIPEADPPPIKTDEPTPTIELPGERTALRGGSITNAWAREAGRFVSNQLDALDTPTLRTTLEGLRDNLPAGEQGAAAISGTIHLAGKLKLELAALTKEMQSSADKMTAENIARSAALEERLAVVENARRAMATDSGSTLRLFNMSAVADILSVDEIIAKTGKTKAEAEDIFLEQVAEAELKDRMKSISDPYDVKIEEALAQNDFGSVGKYSVQKHLAIANETARRTTIGAKIMDGVETLFKKVMEFGISVLFTFKTVALNIAYPAIQSFVRPVMKAIVLDPTERARWSEVSASYSAMASTMRANAMMAWYAARYESPILTSEGFLYSGTPSIKGYKGGFIRFFPRLLQMSDEFLTRVNYEGMIAGRATYDATIKGMELGKSGKELKEFVDAEVSRAVDQSKAIPDDIAQAVSPIVNKGINLKLTGEKLEKWVEKQIKNNPELLKRATNIEVKNAVEDILYKRAFSGNSTPSALAKKYDEFLNVHPSIKFITGQLFFKTVVRLAEAGMRLTPGLNIITPIMWNDLRGKNGLERFVRAQSEIRFGLALAGATLALYTQGRAFGDRGVSDYREAKSTRDNPNSLNYSIKTADGKIVPFNLADPLALPMKMILNSYERINRLDIRKAQGEVIPSTAYEEALGGAKVGIAGIWYAIRDMNLMQGVKWMDDMGNALMDPENQDTKLIKYFDEKLKMFVPNVMRKLAQQNDPSIKDPATFWQVIESRLAPVGYENDNIKTSFSYDLLGNRRRPVDSGSLWNAFPMYTKEDLAKGRSEDDIFVQSELDRLTNETGNVFLPMPYKVPELGNLDLRTVLTSDGSKTLYDRLHEIYRDSDVVQELRDVLESDSSEGTFDQDGEKITELREIINEYRRDALEQLIDEEENLYERATAVEDRKDEVKDGLFDLRPQ